MSQKNEVVTEIEGGLLVQLDGTITDRNGVPVEAPKADTPKAEAKTEAVKSEAKTEPVHHRNSRR